MNFALFSLGDSSYENYQAVGRYFDSKFEQLGATKLYPRGEGNSQFQTTEEDFDKWKKELWRKLVLKYPSIENRTKVFKSKIPEIKIEFSDLKLE